MNGFRCKVANATSTVALAKPEVPRRCGTDPDNHKQFSIPQNCTYGAKQPLYWLNDDSNMFEGDHSPPVYNDLYNFADGAQNDIFTDSYETKPEPGVVAPLPVFAKLETAVKHILNGGVAAVRKALNNAVNDGSAVTPPTKKSGRFTAAPSRRDPASNQEVDSRLFRRYVPRAGVGRTDSSRKLHGNKSRLWNTW